MDLDVARCQVKYLIRDRDGGPARLLCDQHPADRIAFTVVDGAGEPSALSFGQLAALIPRWIPLAAAGLALVAVATTYGRRRRDLARLRGAVGRMR